MRLSLVIAETMALARGWSMTWAKTHPVTIVNFGVVGKLWRTQVFFLERCERGADAPLDHCWEQRLHGESGIILEP